MDIRLGRGVHPHAADFAGEHRWNVIQLADMSTEKKRAREIQGSRGRDEGARVLCGQLCDIISEHDSRFVSLLVAANAPLVLITKPSQLLRSDSEQNLRRY